MHRELAAPFGAESLVASDLELMYFTENSDHGPNALLVAHIDCAALDGSALITGLGRLARHLDRPQADEVVGQLDSWLPWGGRIDRDRRTAMSLVFVTLSPGSQTVVGAETQAESDWSPGDPQSWRVVDQWRWALAMLTPPGHSRHPDQPNDPGSLVTIPGRQGQVVPRGVALLGTRRDSNERGDQQSDRYVTDAIRTRTIYLDALLLGTAQRIAIDVMTDQAAALKDPANRPYELRNLQGQVRRFRNRTWWTSFATAWGGHPDKLLRALQSETNAGIDLAYLVAELKDFTSEVEVASARRINMLVTIVALAGTLGAAGSILGALHASTKVAGIALAVVALVLVSLTAVLARMWGWFRRLER